MVNKKLFLGLIFIGGLQSLYCAAARGAANVARTAATAVRRLPTPTTPNNTPRQARFFETLEAAPQSTAANQAPMGQRTLERPAQSKKITLDPEISRLHREIGELINNIHQLNLQIAALQQQLQASTQREAALQKEIKRLKGEIKKLAAKTSELEWDDFGLNLPKESAREAELAEEINALRKASDEQISIFVERALKAEIENQRFQELIQQLDKAKKLPGNLIPSSDSDTEDDDLETNHSGRPTLDLRDQTVSV